VLAQATGCASDELMRETPEHLSCAVRYLLSASALHPPAFNPVNFDTFSNVHLAVERFADDKGFRCIAFGFEYFIVAVFFCDDFSSQSCNKDMTIVY
jgi:hypothetical protein